MSTENIHTDHTEQYQEINPPPAFDKNTATITPSPMRTTLHQFTALAREIVDATNTEDNDRFDSFDNEKLRIHSTNFGQSKDVRFKDGDNWVRVYLFEDPNPLLNSVQITFADTIQRAVLDPCDFDKLYNDAVEYWDEFKQSGHSILIDTQIKNTLRR